MAALLIPTVAGNPNYTFRTQLDGREYNFRFLWNQRLQRWSFDILDAANVLLVGGIRVVCNWPLLRFYQWDTRLPQGELMAVATEPDDSPPGLHDLEIGRRVELTYFTADTTLESLG